MKAILRDCCDNAKPLTPRWHPFKFGVGAEAPECGQVLCSFTILDGEYNFKKDISKVNVIKDTPVPFQMNKVEMNVLGLRQLESSGFMPIQKAYVRFNVKSLLPPSDSNEAL